MNYIYIRNGVGKVLDPEEEKFNIYARVFVTL